MSTIRDIAKICGVSPATVSLVINNSARKVSSKTRERVMEVVHELDFHPSAHARSLSRGRSNMIGVLTPHQFGLLDLSYFATLISAILDTSAEANQTLALYNGRIWKDPKKRISVLNDGLCDGLIIINKDLIAGSDYLLPVNSLPIVAINSIEDPHCNSIDIDNVATARAMTDYLIGLGHRRIAFLPGNQEAAYAYNRLMGYREALANANIPFDARLVVPNKPEEGKFEDKCAIQIIEQPALRATAFFCCTDDMALRVMQMLSQNGYRIPQDFSVVGINDVPEAALANPPLTTMSQSLHNLGERATRLLLNSINNPDQETLHLIQPAALVVRGSTGPPLVQKIHLENASLQS